MERHHYATGAFATHEVVEEARELPATFASEASFS
jgi:hypothetical protein